jgi:hypothetical protein
MNFDLNSKKIQESAPAAGEGAGIAGWANMSNNS